LFACATLSDGTVKCWNRGGPDAAASQITGAASITSAQKVGAGGYSACALVSNGRVSCWGSNAEGELGTGPAGVAGVIPDLEVSTLAVGGFANCVITKTGAVRCWGENEVGAVGDGAPTGSAAYNRFAPVAVLGLP
jgi:alpha-tubulin suppressor-like RCC1 family protein